MRAAILLALVLAAGPAAAQEIRADVGVAGETDRFLIATVRGGAIEGCVTGPSRVCTRTRRVALSDAQRRHLDVLLARIGAMSRCEPVGFAPDDLPFALTIDGRTVRGHLPRDRAQVPARIDEPCEAEHALAWWIVETFGTGRSSMRGPTAPEGGTPTY